jgi:dUTP pyrophosphatase
MALYIYTDNAYLRTLLEEQVENHRWTDSGFDIPMLEQIVNPYENTYSFDLGIHVAATTEHGDFRPCLLLPRSSLYKTPFRLANSIGLIDQGYRGEVKAKVDICNGYTENVEVQNGARFFQIVQHNFLPWQMIKIVDTFEHLPPSNDTRGFGGFGSTG